LRTISAPAHGRVQTDDLAAAERLNALDRAPFADRINFERTLLQLRFFPALRKILDAAGRALRIVFVIFDRETFGGEETLFDGDPPGPVVGVAVALQADGSAHGSILWRVPC
jgi:hypothetical protein